MEINDDNMDQNDDNCYGFYLYGHCPDSVDTCWYYLVNSNNGEVPEDEDELNYQTSSKNSIETTSTIKWKILVRLESDMNEEYHKETQMSGKPKLWYK